MYRKIVLSGIVVSVLAVTAGVSFFFAFYNVGATHPDPDFVNSFFHYIDVRSIKRNSAGIKFPYDVNDREMYMEGFAEYEAMCLSCHGAPGIKPSLTGQGLFPPPPSFPAAMLAGYTLEDVFWVTKNGIKMTGMPAYGPTHGDKTLWSIAIFLDRSRDMTEQRYRQLRHESRPHGHGGGHHGGGGHH